MSDPLFSFAIITDTHIRPADLDESSPFPVNDLANDRARYAIATIAEEQPEFVLHLGDMVHPLPHLPTFRAACREAHEIFAPVRDIIHFIPGNHDIGDKPNPDAPAGPSDDDTIAQYETEFGPSYQWFERNGCVFVAMNSSLVNSGTEREKEQRTWLEKTLQEFTGRRIFLCTHYPPYIYATDEQSHYDNYAEPGRSWLLGLIEKYSIEAVFSGHVHQFFYNRLNNCTLYCFLPTSFVRQDYAEMFAIGPAKEFGRNDAGKFGIALVDVFERGHRVRVVPTDGKGLAQGDRLPVDRPRWNTDARHKLTVPLRHAWATPIDLPYNGPMEEFSRKRTRNDYTLMRLLQMGLDQVRVPLTDLIDAQIRERVAAYHEAGIRFSYFSIGVPTFKELELLSKHREFVAGLEIVSASDHLGDLQDQWAALETLNDMPLFVGKSHSSKHEARQGSKFAHSVSSGFKWEARNRVVEGLNKSLGRELVNGLVFQVNLDDPLEARLGEMDAFAAANGLTIAVNVRLAHPNPATANFDDEAIQSRVRSMIELAPEMANLSLGLDTFVDIDRGYNPRHGLLDRHLNFRSTGRLLAVKAASGAYA